MTYQTSQTQLLARGADCLPAHNICVWHTDQWTVVLRPQNKQEHLNQQQMTSSDMVLKAKIICIAISRTRPSKMNEMTYSCMSEYTQV